MALLLGHDQAVSQWAGEQFGAPMIAGCIAWGVTDAAGKIKGAVLFFNHYKHGNMEMAMVGDVVHRGVLRAIAKYVFRQLGCTRLTARTARGNKLARRLLPRAGFKFEGTNARFYGPEREDDALVFALFSKSGTRWL